MIFDTLEDILHNKGKKEEAYPYPSSFWCTPLKCPWNFEC